MTERDTNNLSSFLSTDDAREAQALSPLSSLLDSLGEEDRSAAGAGFEDRIVAAVSLSAVRSPRLVVQYPSASDDHPSLTSRFATSRPAGTPSHGMEPESRRAHSPQTWSSRSAAALACLLAVGVAWLAVPDRNRTLVSPELSGERAFLVPAVSSEPDSYLLTLAGLGDEVENDLSSLRSDTDALHTALKGGMSAIDLAEWDSSEEGAS